MKRTQIYLTDDQQDFLENIAFLTSKKEHKKVTLSSVIRRAIDDFMENYKDVENETEAILKSSLLCEGLKTAQQEKGFLDHKDIFGD